MNKKKLNIILIPLAISLWILIVIKVFSYTRPKQITDESIKLYVPVLEINNPSDTISLLLNYPDPFTLNPYRDEIPNTVALSQTTGFFDHSPDYPLPDVVFAGMIEADNQNNAVGLLIVNGRSVLGSKGDTIGGMQVISCWKDSVRIRFNRREYTVQR